MKELWEFYQTNYEKLFQQLLQHIGLTFFSVLFACIISIPLGIWIARRTKLAPLVLNVTGILQTIPSIALLGFLIPVLGIGVEPAIFALFLYSLLPIVRNVYTGITGIDPQIIESAKGMGMSPHQVLFKVKLPLALPTIFAGIRTATVINVGVATLAAYIAAGGLGEFIFGGIALNNTTMIIAGALPAALLAIVLDFLLSLLQKSSFSRRKNKSLILTSVVLIFALLTAFNFKNETKLKAGFTPEFCGRKDGLPALRKIYGLKISNVVLGPALMYQAIHNDYTDVISGYSTDGRIKSYQLKILVDDKHSFPPYQAALLVRNSVLTKNPQLKTVIAKLNGTITDSTMTYLNYQVDDQHLAIEKVARDFLRSNALYQPPKKGEKVLTIGSKIFTEQYILTEIYKQLIEGYTDFKVETRQGLGGTKICFEALKAGEIDMYPEYSGTALQVLLNEKQQKNTSRQKVFQQVQKALQQNYDLYYSAPLGFNNTYALMMRQQQADKLGIDNISDLENYLEK